MRDSASGSIPVSASRAREGFYSWRRSLPVLQAPFGARTRRAAHGANQGSDGRPRSPRSHWTPEQDLARPSTSTGVRRTRSEPTGSTVRRQTDAIAASPRIPVCPHFALALPPGAVLAPRPEPTARQVATRPDRGASERRSVPRPQPNSAAIMTIRGWV